MTVVEHQITRLACNGHQRHQITCSTHRTKCRGRSFRF